MPNDPSIPLPDMNKLLSTFAPVARAAQPVGNPNAAPAVLEIGFPAVAHNNANTLHMTRTAATDRNLPNQFPCFRVLFSDQTQGAIMVPEAAYVVGNPEHYPVRWTKDGRSFSVDLSPMLVQKHWGVPIGYLRKAPVSLYRGVQTFGTLLYVDLKNSTVAPRKKKKQEQKDASTASQKPAPASPQAPAPAPQTPASAAPQNPAPAASQTPAPAAPANTTKQAG